jgi:hypothetical protein
MSSLSERFKRLPEEQILRTDESARQARETSELLKRLRVTRQEAEKLAKEEIERTRRIQREEVEMHPEVTELKKRLRNAERDKEIWERKQRDLEKSYKLELDSLKRDEGNLIARYNSALEEEFKSRSEQEKFEHDREEKDRRFRALEVKLDDMRREEEPQFINDMEVLKRQINELEGKLPFGDFESNKKQLELIENEIRNLQEDKDRSDQERLKLAEKEKQVAQDLLKAQSLVKDAKSFEEEKKRELENLKEIAGGAEAYETAQIVLFDAEKQIKELESSHVNLIKERDNKNRTLEEKSKHINAIRSEIDRLQNELTSLETSQFDDYNTIYELENQINRYDIDLKYANELVNASRSNLEFLTRERSRISESVAKLESDISELHRSHQESENEEKRAIQLCDEIGKRCNEVEKNSLLQTDRVKKLNRKALDLQEKLADFDRIKADINNKTALLNQVQNRWNEWRVNRRGPIQDEFDGLRNWLSSHPKLEAVSTKKSQAASNDLERVRNRIIEVQNRYPTTPHNFEDPNQLKDALNAKEAEIQSRLESRSGPASPRFLNQLEREAEAIMRAEIAATHERRQEAIDRDANELSKLRLSLHPQVILDEEARRRMWRLNQETGETGPIAEQILQLCQTQNITVKPE